MTGEGTVKVNLLEAVLGGAAVPIVQILYQAIYYTFPENQQQLETLRERLSPNIGEMLPSLMMEKPDYRAIKEQLEEKYIECQYCKQRKIPVIDPICAIHLYCSEECLTAAREAASITDSQCPLCSVKTIKSRRVLTIKKRTPEQKNKENSRKCAKCWTEFECNTSESWRLDRLGSSEYEKVKLYCTESCYLQENPSKVEEIKENSEVLCIVCRGNIPTEGILLHCGQHGLCSTSCRSAYYHTDNYTMHQTDDGTCICYQCLEQYLTEIGTGQDLPEIIVLRQKLAYFKQPQGYIKGEMHPHCPNCTYIDCGYYLTPSIIPYHNYQTYCLFCAIAIRITKRTEGEFVLSEDLPFLLRCEYRLHGICSRTCLRRQVLEDSKALHCPRCRSSVISIESVLLGLKAANPTLECIRRTPYMHFCREGVPVFVLEGCSHEMCAHEIEANVGEDGLVHCSICNNTATIEEACAAQYHHTTKHYREG